MAFGKFWRQRKNSSGCFTNDDEIQNDGLLGSNIALEAVQIMTASEFDCIAGSLLQVPGIVG